MTKGQAKKRLTGILSGMLFAFCVTVIVFFISTETAHATEVVDSGIVGSIEWSLDSDGVLTVSGEGRMGSWNTEGSAPWASYNASIKKVIISDGVTTICDFAFSGCNNLSSITLPESIVVIGRYSFRYCSHLESIYLPDSISVIENSAFAGCTNLKSFIIPSGVTRIESGTFSGCGNLKNVTIPASVAYIGDYAFWNCSSLESVMIPEGVAGIQSRSFEGCKSLTSVEIPEGVEYIGVSAFKDCNNLENVTIPSTVTKIYESAFSGCSSLASVTLPDGVTSVERSTFSDCSNLANITLPNGVTSIGDYAFSGCSSLASITLPDGVMSIGASAFLNCSTLASITIPNGVISIGYNAFSGCSNLASITLPDGLTSIDDFTFSGCSSLTSITVPDDVTSIGSSTFSGCSSLKSITIPDGVTSIGSSAFSGCSSLESITIPDGVTSIQSSTFSGCSSLVSITLPDGVTGIGASAFLDCSNLTSITIPDGTRTLGVSAFSGCSNLTSIMIPESVQDIGGQAFSGCGNLVIYCEASEPSAGWFYTWNNNNRPVYYSCSRSEYEFYTSLTGNETEIVIPEGTSFIPYGAFRDNKNLVSITIPESVTIVGASAFSGCSSLTSITIPDGVTSVGASAFSGCSSLTSIAIPDGVTSIEYSTFSGCSNLASITIPDGVTSIESSAFSGCSSLTSITIPDGVTSIESSAFSGCSSLTSITIPDGVTSIGSSAFSGCSGLINVTIPNSVTNIWGGAFNGCSSLESIELPFVGASNTATDAKALFGYIFGSEEYSGSTAVKQFYAKGQYYNCTFYIPSSLKTVTVTGGTKLSYGAFFGCSNLTNITMPNSVTSIGDSAFSGCSSLTNITIPDGVTSIGDSTFRDCSSLTSITIPEGMTRIGDYSFYDCSNLKEIIIPYGVKEIGDYAFSGCRKIEEFIIPNTVERIENGAFTGTGCKRLVIPESVTYIGSYGVGIVYNGDVDVYVFRHSEAYMHFTSWKKKYYNSCNIKIIGEDVEPHQANRLMGFTQDPIIMEADGTIRIKDYLKTDLNEEDYEISVSNEDLFMYDNGQIANLGEGECTVTVSYGDMTSSATLKAISGIDDQVESISFEENHIQIHKGDSAVNPLSIMPFTAVVPAITWTSEDESIATVTNGVINGVNAGHTTITASLDSNPEISASFDVDVIVGFQEIIFFDDFLNYSVHKGQEKPLRYYVYPYDSTDVPEIQFQSSNEDILAIDDNGMMVGVSNGTAIITVSVGDYRKNIEVVVDTPLSGIAIEEKNVRILADESYQLNVLFEPSDTTERTVAWTSDKESVATVDENGLVTAHGKGIATITATAGDYSASCTIVCPAVSMTGISLEEGKTITWGEIYSPKVTYIPRTTTDDKTVTWQSSDDSIFTISADGVVIPTGIGTATLTATVGQFSATQEITVTKAMPVFDTPEGVTATCEQELSEISLPEGFAWLDPAQSVGSSGEKLFPARFTPTDQAHYQIVDNIFVPVRVAHSYAEEWSKDEANHWHACACGEMIDASAHVYSNWIVTKEPTCTESGSKERKCTVCGGTETAAIDATGHAWPEEYTVDKEPTCTEAGVKSIHCTVCGEKKPDSEEVIEALGHTYGEWTVVKEPTCTEPGSKERKCTVCGETETAVIVATGHDWAEEYTVDKEPTCTEAGVKSIHCTVCGEKKPDSEEVIEALGHAYGEWTVVKEPTCTKPGSKERKCTVCGETETAAIVATGHDWAEEYTVDKEPSCTEAGVKSIHCTVCGEKKLDSEEVIEALGHTYGEWTVVKEPTCTEPGSKERKCTVCGESETAEIAATGHGWSEEYTVDKEPTCTEAGVKSIHCTVCGEKKPDSEEVIEALGHAYGEWTVVKEPTCTEPGSKERKCTVCGETETAAIGATGHDWSEKYTVDKEPTCTEAGVKSIHCTVCGEKKPDSEEVIEALGHAYGDWVVVKEPTCTEPGSKERKCTVCGETEMAAIDATGHDWLEEYTVDKEPTCTEAGVKSIHCTVCGEIKPGSAMKIDMLGHDWSEWKETKPATELEEGIETRICSRCDEVETRQIPKPDHIHVLTKVEAKDATCTEDGNTEYWICDNGVNPCGRYFSDAGGTDEINAEMVVINATGHKYGDWTETKTPTCSEKGEQERVCSICETKETVSLDTIAHKWAVDYTVDTPATCSEEGSESIHCLVCGAIKEGSAKPIPKLIPISEVSISSIPDQSYTGAAIKPVPTIVYGGQTLVEGADYSVAYKANINPGTATVTITGINRYTGTVSKTFVITKAPTAKSFVLGGNTMNFKQNTYSSLRLPSVARPYQLTLTARFDKSMLIQWTDCKKLNADIDGYLIMRRVGSEKAYTQYVKVPASVNYYYDKGISKANTNYYYIVLAYKQDAAGNYTVSTDSMSVVGLRYDSVKINPHECPAKKVGAALAAKFGLPTINRPTLTLKVGQTYDLKLTYPKLSFSTWTRWRSDKSSIARVNSKGRVTAVSPGKVLISGRTPNGRDIRCTLTVIP